MSSDDPVARPDRSPIVIVGAGLAGLTCARDLLRAGLDVVVLDREGEVGGRVRTEIDERGFRFDRGFQVLLSGYPALRRNVDLDALGARAFDAGALIWTGERLHRLANPWRHPDAALGDLTSPVFPLADKVRLARWALAVRRASWLTAADAATQVATDRSALDELRARGFSEAFIDRFARPFWGGITLDPSLAVSAGVLAFTLKMFLAGSGVLPRDGVGALPAAIAADLPDGAVRLGQEVAGLAYANGRVAGVRRGDGTVIDATAVVIATDPPTAAALTGIDLIPTDPIGCVTVYLSSPDDPGVGRTLVLDGTGTRHVNHIAPLSAVQPTYAPEGTHLLAAVMLGEDALATDDGTLAAWALADLGAMVGAGTWTVERIVRVPFALYRQPPGLHRVLPDATTGIPGLVLASDATVDASVNGAIFSGEAAARVVRAAASGAR